VTNLPPGSDPTQNPDGEDAVPPMPPMPPGSQPSIPDVAAERSQQPAPVVPPPAGQPAAQPTVQYAAMPPDQYGQVPPGQVPPGQYGQPPRYGGQPPAPSGGVNGLALGAVILGGVAFILAFVPIVNIGSWFLALIGLVLGIIALVRRGGGKALALTGTILSGVALILSVILAVLYTIGFFATAMNQAGAFLTPAPVPVEPLPSDEPDDGSPAPDTLDLIPALFGQVVTYDDGMQISVSEPESFTPSANSAGADQEENLSFTVTIFNGTTADYDPFPVSTVTSDDIEASLIIDPDNEMEGLPPIDTIPAGQTVTFVEGYSVADATDLTYDIAPGFEYTTARYTN
jgi:hypothetical protein